MVRWGEGRGRYDSYGTALVAQQQAATTSMVQQWRRGSSRYAWMACMHAWMASRVPT